MFLEAENNSKDLFAGQLPPLKSKAQFKFLQSRLESKLKEIHEQYGDHLKDGPMNLLIVVAPRHPDYSPVFYQTRAAMVVPEYYYASCGTGKPVSDYLVNTLYDYGRREPRRPQPHFLNESRAMGVFAAFILREAQRSSSGVGLGADMVFIHEGNKSLYPIAPPQVKKELEECLPLSVGAFILIGQHKQNSLTGLRSGSFVLGSIRNSARHAIQTAGTNITISGLSDPLERLDLVLKWRIQNERHKSQSIHQITQ